MIKKNRNNKATAKRKRPNTPTEPKNFAYLTVKHWLKKNANRFMNPPRIIDVRKNGISLKFRGITPQIVLRIDQSAFVVALGVWVFDDKDNWWDIIKDFDLCAKQNDAGQYYCSDCKDEYREYFPSKYELWEKHCLEPVLAWANENLRPDRWLCLFGKLDEVTRANLVNAEELLEYRQVKSFYAAYPLGVKYHENTLTRCI